MAMGGETGLNGAGPTGDGGSAPAESVSYQLDLESEDTPDRSALQSDFNPDRHAAEQQAAALPAASPAPSAAVAPAAGGGSADLMARVEAAERRAIAAEAAVAPWLTHMAQQAGPQQPRRPTREQLLSDPNVTVQDLLAYLEHQQSETRMGAAQQAQLESRRGASEMYARGLLSAEAMGDPQDSFDALRETYVRPLYEAQPYLRDVIHAMFPDQPAMGEVAVAWVRRIAETAKNDPVQTYRRLAEFVRGGQAGAAQTVTRAIAEAAERGAHRVAPGSGGRMTGAETQTRHVNGKQIWQMSDADFERLDQQLTGGL